MKKNSGNILLGIIILIVIIISIFVGLPYVLTLFKSGRNLFPYQAPRTSFSVSQTTTQTTPVVPSENQKPLIGPGQSIFKGKVSIGNIYTAGRQQINLSAPQSSSGAVNITGWKIVSSRGFETVIGRANSLIGFGIAGDIWLAPGDQVQVIASQSPVVDSFRVNKCFGWLSNIYNFDPLVLSSCPRFNLSDLQGLDGACQDLILNSGSCRAPSSSVLNNYSASCRGFVDQNLNYNACVGKYRNDKDFFGEWRIYTGSNFLMFDSLHDLLQLKDQSGFVVDQYQY